MYRPDIWTLSVFILINLNVTLTQQYNLLMMNWKCLMFCVWTNSCLFFSRGTESYWHVYNQNMIYLLTLHCYMAPSNSFFVLFFLCLDFRDSSTAKCSYWSKTWSHGKPRKDLMFFSRLQLFVLVNFKAPWAPVHMWSQEPWTSAQL